MRFLGGTTKVVWTQIVHKSQNYSIIGDYFYFQRRDGVLQQAIGKGETSHLSYEFHDGFYRGHFAKQIIIEIFCKQVITSLPSSRIPMIIAKVMMYVKFMHKGLLWMALYIPFHLWNLLKNGELI
jgi:hypothetical protein